MLLDECLDPDVPVAKDATLEQALRWVAYKLPPRPQRFELLLGYPQVLTVEVVRVEDADLARYAFPQKEDPVNTAYRRLLLRLGAGALVATGRRVPYDARHSDNKTCVTEEIPSSAWSLDDVYWANDRVAGMPQVGVDDGLYEAIRIPFADLQREFPAEAAADVEPPPTKSKRGRPPKVPRELWLERLAVLILSGAIGSDASQDAAAQALVDELRKQGRDNGVSVETARKEWLGPLLGEAKERAGGK